MYDDIDQWFSAFFLCSIIITLQYIYIYNVIIIIIIYCLLGMHI